MDGAQASELTVPASMLLRKPRGFSFSEAAGLLGSGTTAAHALEAVRVGTGDVVLIHGVSGAVGSMVAQLALLRGTRVIGTASPTRHARLRELGVDPVAYGPGLEDRVRALAPGGVSAAIDTAGTPEALRVSAALVTEPVKIVSLVAYQEVLAIGGQALGPGPATQRIRVAARHDLAKLAAERRVSVEIAAALPFSEVRSAYELLATGHAGGKVLLITEAGLGRIS
jgi:NADPH2:quinone reductase